MRVRLLRGRVVIREQGESARSSLLWTPAPGQRAVSTHRGVVLAMGPPALHHGHEVAPGFRVGALVQYHWETNEDAFTREWPEDGQPACWVRQFAVDGVLEPETPS